MYPLPVVLLEIDERLMPTVRRELANASAEVESEFDLVTTAIECLRHEKKERKLLLIQASGVSATEKIHRLSDGLSGWPILALAPGEDGAGFLRLNRAGAIQVVALPLDRDDFRAALDLIGSQFAIEAADRTVIAVTGASGGSGVTTIAVNLACEVAERLGRSTILAEFSEQMGALASHFDVEPRVTVPDLIREIHRVDDYLLEKALISVAGGVRILAGPATPRSPLAPLPEHLIRIVHCLKKLASVTILDMPGTFDDREFQVLRACDHVVVVGGQTVPSIRSLRLFCGSLPEERLRHSLSVVINRFNPSIKGFSRDEIEQMLGVPRVLTVANDFHAVNLSVNKGRPLRQVAPATPILRDLELLIRKLLGNDDDCSNRNGRGLFRRVLHAFAR
jgi:pilus assembly protein CpaE